MTNPVEELTEAMRPIVDRHGQETVTAFVSAVEQAPEDLRGIVIATAHSALTIMLMQSSRNPELCLRVLIEAIYKGLSNAGKTCPTTRNRLIAVAHAAVTEMLMAATTDPAGFASTILDAVCKSLPQSADAKTGGALIVWLDAGIHDIPPREYHADPCPAPSLSRSIAKLLVERSPAHAYAAHPRLGGPRNRAID